MNVLTILPVLGLSVVIMCSGETFYIVPVNSTEGCDVKPCLTLDQLARVVNTPNLSNLTLHFLPGNHILNQKLLHISNKEAVIIIGSSLDTKVWLQGTNLSISNVELLAIEDITLASNNDRTVTAFINTYSCSNFWLVRCTLNSTNLFVSTNVSIPTSISISHLSILLCEFHHSIVYVSTLNAEVTLQTYVSDTNVYRGGSIRQRSGEMYLTNCKFKDNNGRAVEIRESTKIIISNSSIINNTFNQLFNKFLCYFEGRYLKIVDCNFTGNVDYEGVLRARVNRIFITNSKFISNECFLTILVDEFFSTYIEDKNKILCIKDSTFIKNHGKSGGGLTNYVPVCEQLLIIITNCEFTANQAVEYGGAIISASEIIISDSTFTKNKAEVGGAIYSLGSFMITNCTFTSNYLATSQRETTGAAIFASLEEQLSKTSIVWNTIFLTNIGSGTVTVFGNKLHINNTKFINNYSYSTNRGCFYLFDSRVDITGPMTVSGNIGGGIHAIQSEIYINSTEVVVISNNTAISGGGIMLRESELVVQSSVIISDNKAQIFGGGIYAYQSLIKFKCKQENEGLIINNTVGRNGGGVCAIASTIKLTYYYATISSNTALLNGGGIYLQENSRIYILKKKKDSNSLGRVHVGLKIDINSALYGGGIFVADNTTTGGQQCQEKKRQSISETLDLSDTEECFIQTIKLYYRQEKEVVTNIVITNNTAVHGSALYGGLLDRCTVSTLAEVYNEVTDGLHYFRETVQISKGTTITSDPVQVVFCGMHSFFIETRKGEPFVISVKAIDQVGNPVNATIRSSVITESGVGRLKEGQTEQMVSNQCTELEYNVFSQDSSAQLELYADGPCTNLGISKQTITATFLPCTCPIGLQPSHSQIECACVCSETLQQYQITNCSQQAGTIQLETNLWIGVANSTNGTGYIIHDCPFDYCIKRPVNISLNSSQERDRQCAFNRSGVLCGECQQGLSLVLATSKCKECSDIYLLLLLPFALVGIALVAFILFFNITIATGTIPSLIIYSNLLSANYFSQPSVLTVFISWVNLDLGIETCFYNGMSSQAKVLLQLVFPTYLFLLMFLIIILCRYSNFFATLLSKRNPVAALCTLIFLSYSKLLQFIIAALQSTVLEFPEGSRQRVWLYDGNVHYFTPSHTPHFLAAAIIVTVGGLITLQLFFAQWIPRCSKWKLMKWTRNTKYTAFMDAYHAPFTRKHRYWVGLLLLGLIIHNSIAALATNDSISVLSMGCIGASQLMFKLGKNRIYKSWVNNQIENAFLLNLIFLALGTLYARSTETRNVTTIVANVSMGISAALFLIIIFYHFYKYVYLLSRFHRRHRMQIKEIIETIIQRFKKVTSRQDKTELVCDQGGTLETHYTAMKTHPRREQDLDVLAPITTDDYRQAPPPSDPHPKVTYTVVETTA